MTSTIEAADLDPAAAAAPSGTIGDAGTPASDASTPASDRAATARPAPAAAPLQRRRRWPAVLCGVLAVVGFASAGWFWRAWSAQKSSDQAAGAATVAVRATATGFVAALTNFDPGTVNADFAQVQSYAAGSFASQAKQYFGSSIRKELATAGAASRGKLADLFVESVNGNQASVFAVVDQTYLNDKLHAPVADTLRLELGMTQVPAGWRISAVTVIQSPAGFPGS